MLHGLGGLWGGRCALSGACMGGGDVALTLTRWDRSKPASVGNLILLTKIAAAQHDVAPEPFGNLPEPFVRAVEQTLRKADRARAAWAVAGP